MAVYVAIWDLDGEGPTDHAARERLAARLRLLDHVRNPSLANAAWISTYLTVADLERFLGEALDGDGVIFVSLLQRGGYQGWLRRETWDWIEARL